MYKCLHEYSHVIRVEVHIFSIEINMNMTSMGPNNITFLDFDSKSIQLDGLVDMVQLDMDFLFSRDIFLKDLEKGVGRKVVDIEVSGLHSSPFNEDT